MIGAGIWAVLVSICDSHWSPVIFLSGDKVLANNNPLDSLLPSLFGVTEVDAADEEGAGVFFLSLAGEFAGVLDFEELWFVALLVILSSFKPLELLALEFAPIILQRKKC